jgi:membrane protein required for colicin V production
MIIDIGFLLVLGYSFYLGYSRGIIMTVFQVIAVFLGLLVSFKLTPILTTGLEKLTNSNDPWLFIAAFLFSIVVIFSLMRYFAKSLEGLMKSSKVNAINQILGGIFLAMVFTLFYSLFIWFADESKVLSDGSKLDSKSFSFLESYPGMVQTTFGWLEPHFQDFFNRSENIMEKISKGKKSSS